MSYDPQYGYDDELECECISLDEYLDIAQWNNRCQEYNEDFTPDRPWGGPWTDITDFTIFTGDSDLSPDLRASTTQTFTRI